MHEESARLSLKIMKRDKAALRRLAQAEGEPMSVVLRRILRKELERKHQLTEQPKMEEMHHEI